MLRLSVLPLQAFLVCVPIASRTSDANRRLAAYALYFDHKRRTDPDFRKALKREARREARVARSQAEAAGAAQKNAIKRAVQEAEEEGFPSGVEDREAYFMQQVAEGESLSQDSEYPPYQRRARVPGHNR